MDKLFVSYLTTNVVGLVILLILYFFMRKQSKILSLDQKFFMGIIVVNAIIIILDTAEWYLDGRTSQLAILLLRPVYVLYYILNPAIPVLWLFYVYLNANETLGKIRWYWVLFLGPFVINFILAILSYKYNIFFTINEVNVYSRGEFFHLETLITYGYLLSSVIFILAVRKRIKKEKILTLVLYVVIPSLVALLQIAFYGLNLIWISTTVATLFVFISLQSKSLVTDYLTGIYNRHHLEDFLSSRLKSKKCKKFIGGIMIDIDKFKDINDKYGHVAGDNALEDTACILFNSIRKKDFLARYAGDEFVIVTESDQEDYIYKVISKLEENLKIYNERPDKKIVINLSYGSYVFASNKIFDFKKFIDTVDKEMYKNKRDKYEQLELKR